VTASVRLAVPFVKRLSSPRWFSFTLKHYLKKIPEFLEDICKEAAVIHVLKNRTNALPVSVFSNFLKFCENIIHDQLAFCLNVNHMDLSKQNYL
jgi:hypothetical protein